MLQFKLAVASGTKVHCPVSNLLSKDVFASKPSDKRAFSRCVALAADTAIHRNKGKKGRMKKNTMNPHVKKEREREKAPCVGRGENGGKIRKNETV